MISLIGCATPTPVQIDTDITYPFKPVLEMPEFPAYPGLKWDYVKAENYWILPDAEMDKLITWIHEVESFPRMVRIVYEYTSD